MNFPCPRCRVWLVRVLDTTVDVPVVVDEDGDGESQVVGYRPTVVRQNVCPVCLQTYTVAIDKVGDVRPAAA